MSGRAAASKAATPEVLTDVFAKHVDKPGFVGCNADEKISIDHILRLATLWRELRLSLSDKLNMKDLVLQQTFKNIYEMKKDLPAFRKLKASDVQEWAKVQSKRIRDQARAIGQAELKTPNKSWLATLWGADADNVDDGESTAVAPSDDHDVEDDGEQEESEQEVPESEDDLSEEKIAEKPGKQSNKKVGQVAEKAGKVAEKTGKVAEQVAERMGKDCSTSHAPQTQVLPTHQ